MWPAVGSGALDALTTAHPRPLPPAAGALPLTDEAVVAVRCSDKFRFFGCLQVIIGILATGWEVIKFP